MGGHVVRMGGERSGTRTAFCGKAREKEVGRKTKT
jgi:hypothetical protein